MDFLWEIFVWSLANHEMTARRKYTPELSNIWISGLRNMFKNTVGKNEYKLTIREWKVCGIWSVGKRDLGSSDRSSKQVPSSFNSREAWLYPDHFVSSKADESDGPPPTKLDHPKLE